MNTLRANDIVKKEMFWLSGPIFLLGGIAMTFMSLPLIAALGIFALLYAPIYFAWRWYDSTERQVTRMARRKARWVRLADRVRFMGDWVGPGSLDESIRELRRRQKNGEIQFNI